MPLLLNLKVIRCHELRIFISVEIQNHDCNKLIQVLLNCVKPINDTTYVQRRYVVLNILQVVSTDFGFICKSNDRNARTN